MIHLLFLVGLAMVYALGLGGIFVWAYNRSVCRWREKKSKKIIALAGLPATVILGFLFSWILGRENIPAPVRMAPAFILIPAALYTLWSATRQSLQDLETQSNRRIRRIPMPPLPPRTDLSTGERIALRVLSPVNEIFRPVFVREEFQIPEFPETMRGPRILFLTDYHLHRFLPDEFFVAIQEYSLRYRPDLILLGGDYVTRAAHLHRIEPVLGALRAPLGVFAVRGNHDFWTDPRRVARTLERAGVTLLSNEVVTLTHRGTPLELLGIEHPYLPLGPGRLRALEPTGVPRLALVHTPDAFPLARKLGAFLALAGHTHGGQVRFPLFGTTLSSTAMGPGYGWGRGELDGMATMVSAGLGAFFPMRWRCPPEAHLIQLRGGSPRTLVGAASPGSRRSRGSR